MSAAGARVIPIAAAPVSQPGACTGAEAFALMVLGDAMAPEFVQGDIIVIEPDGLATDGAFVLAHVGGEWIFRQLAARAGGWALRALNPGYEAIEIPDLAAVRGVVIQKSRPGRRRLARHYGPQTADRSRSQEAPGGGSASITPMGYLLSQRSD